MSRMKDVAIEFDECWDKMCVEHVLTRCFAENELGLIRAMCGLAFVAGRSSAITHVEQTVADTIDRAVTDGVAKDLGIELTN